MSYPVLYQPNTREYTTNGIGVLSDAISCTVSEEINGAYTAEMQYPLNGVHYSEIQHDSVVLLNAGERAGLQPFEVDEFSRPINGVVTIYLKHVRYRLKSIPVGRCSATSAAAALEALRNHAAVDCPFTVWTDVTTQGDFVTEKPDSFAALLAGQNGSVLDVYGGEYEFDGWAVKLHKHRGNDSGVIIEYGKNLIDLQQEDSIADLQTGVYPYWQNQDEYMELPEKVVQLDASGYGYPRIRTLALGTQEFAEKPTEDELREYAQSYIKSSDLRVPKVSIKVDFVRLWETDDYREDPYYKQLAGLERLGLGDRPTVRYLALGVDVQAEIVSCTWDCLAERYTAMEIGSVRSNIADTIANISQTVKKTESKLGAEITAAQKHVSDLITGATGGYVRINFGDDGQTAEILVMDTPDKGTAQHVIRLNKEGMGFSRSGYDGPFEAAISIDGYIIADYITAGTLAAALIKTGIIQSATGITYFDLDKGIVRLGYDDDVNGHKYAQIAPDGIQWMGGHTYAGASAQGLIKSDQYTCTFASDTRYQRYGWVHKNSNGSESFQGLKFEQVDAEAIFENIRKISHSGTFSGRRIAAWEYMEVASAIGDAVLKTDNLYIGNKKIKCNDDGSVTWE